VGNLIYNSKTSSSFKLSTITTDLVYKSLVIEGSKIAKSKWEKDIILWLSERNQNLLGSGMVGFDVMDMGWKSKDCEDQKKFLFSIVDNSINNETWNNFNYVSESNIVKDKLKEFKNLLFGINVDEKNSKPLIFLYNNPNKEELSFCRDHLTIEINNEEVEEHKCFVCSTLIFDERYKTSFEEIQLTDNFWNGSIYLLKPINEINSYFDLYKALDNFSKDIGLKLLGNLWNRISIEEGLEFLKNGLTYDLAFTKSHIVNEEFSRINYEKIMSRMHIREIKFYLSSAYGSPWSKSYGCWNLTDKWTFNVANVLATKNQILFNLFRSED
jgi:hypothetical protein